MKEEHKDLECQMCGNFSKNSEAFRIHQYVHKGELKQLMPKVNEYYYPGNVHNYRCTPCKESFRSDDELMNHMSLVHLTAAQRRGDGLAKYMNNQGNQDYRQPPCRNGDHCIYHRQFRCRYYHERPPQERQVRHTRQAPTNQWKVVQGRWQQSYQFPRVVESYEEQAPVPWCRYGNKCKLGRPGSWDQCLLRHPGEDFPSLPHQGKQ